jgi:hypothetical protein
MLALWLLWSFGRHKPDAGGFCLYLNTIVRRGVKGWRRRDGGGGLVRVRLY